MLSSMRSGTHFLGDYLSSHPQLMFTSEIVHPQIYPNIHKASIDDLVSWVHGSLCTKAGYNRLIGEPEKLAHRPIKNFDDMVYLGGVIHKWQFHEHRLSVGDLYRVMPNARFIVLERKNKIKQYISLMLSTKTGIWGVKDKSKVNYENQTIEFGIENYKKWKDDIHNYYYLIDNAVSDKPSVKVIYEDLVRNPNPIMARIFGMLSLDTPINYDIQYKKLQRKQPKDYISNWNDVSDFVESEMGAYD